MTYKRSPSWEPCQNLSASSTLNDSITVSPLKPLTMTTLIQYWEPGLKIYLPSHVHQPARTTITKHSRLGSWTIEVHLLIILEGRSPRSSCQQDWFLLRPLPLACLWLPSWYVLTWPFPLCTYVPGVSSFSYQDTSSIGLDPHAYDFIYP